MLNKDSTKGKLVTFCGNNTNYNFGGKLRSGTINVYYKFN